MKNILLILFFHLFTTIAIFSQIVVSSDPCGGTPPSPPGPDDRVLSVGRPARQSSNYSVNNGQAGLVVDGNKGNNSNISDDKSKTSREQQPWVEVDLGASKILKAVQVYFSTEDLPQGLNGYYIIFSDHLIPDVDLSTVLASNSIQYIYIDGTTSSGQVIPVGGKHAKYLRLQFEGLGTASFYEIEAIGEPGSGTTENCFNGIDDNGDCKADCEDPWCAPTIWQVRKTNPTCPVCDDGKVEISVSSLGNLPVLYSIDGGVTFSSCPSVNEDWCVFDGLPDGDYPVVVTNGICTTFWRNNPVIIRSPTGDPNADGCPNSGFEEGGYSFWNFQRGYSEAGSDDFEINSSVPNQAFLLSSSNLVDEAGIPLQSPSGNYFLRLGDYYPSTLNIGPIRAGRAIYCLDINESNANNRFWYAFAFQGNNHDQEDNPYFLWNVYEKVGTVIESEPLGCTGCYGKLEGVLGDQFYEYSQGWGYKSWTCESVDLREYINKEVCFVFQVADCEDFGHLGYAYIDGICSEPSNPEVKIDLDAKICGNQPVVVNAFSEYGTKYEWSMSQIGDDGVINTVTIVELTDGFTVPPINDALKLYKQKVPNYEFKCDHKFSITLTVYNDCGGKTMVTKKFEFLCSEYQISYKDILACAISPNNDVPITGVVNCTGCTYDWNLIYDPVTNANSVGTYLSGTTSAFPTILYSQNVLALGPHYEVVATTPEGCMYRDTVVTRNIFNLQSTTMELTAASTTCSFSGEFTLTFEDEIDSDDLVVSFSAASNYGLYLDNTPLNQVPLEAFDLTLVSEPGKSNKHTYRPDVDQMLRGFDHRIIVNIKIKGYGEANTTVLGTCSFSLETVRSKDSPFFGVINVYTPNTFAPVSAPQMGTLWYPGFSANVYEAWVSIWDVGSGSKIFEKHVVSDGDNPIDPTDLGWDGMWRDKNAANAQYTALVDYQNCQVAPSSCFDNQTVIGPELQIGFVGSGAGIDPAILTPNWANSFGSCVPDPLIRQPSNIRGYNGAWKFICSDNTDCHHNVKFSISN